MVSRRIFMEAPTVPAAQYLRMSTEHQQYSLNNQADAIARYAAQRGFQIVKTYSDAARSGLRLKNRAGLKQLLKDSVDGHKEFRAVLVYDVSRWGRFQDHDESAHYEYLCKSSGVPVHYCAEPFNGNDGAIGWILKSLKRTMAAEYSRELSVKVKTGLTRLARLGYKLGGTAPYGLRRQLLDKEGKPKQILEYGERKSLVEEHVTFIPGPPEEVAVMRRIFHEFVNQRHSPKTIAARLNREGIPFLQGRRWLGGTLRIMLQNPHYMGMLVWGRTTEFLSSPAKRLPLEQWEICANAFQPIIPAELFLRAQQIFANCTFRLSDDQLLQRLKQTLEACGHLNADIIDQSPLCPGTTAYFRRFGNLLNAYERIGYNPPRSRKQATSRARGMLIRESLIRSVLEAFPDQIEEAKRRSGLFKRVLRCRKTGLKIAIVVAWRYWTGNGTSWRVRPSPIELKRPTIVALLDETNSRIESLRVFPRLFPQPQFNIRVGPLKDSPRTGFALENLSDLFTVLKRARQR
jgi:DNA invertase Pin-like site-specific DNA recombinase